MCHVGTKTVRPFISSSSELQSGLNMTKPIRPYFDGWTRSSKIDGNKLSMLSTCRIPASRRTVDKLTGRSGHSHSITSQHRRQKSEAHKLAHSRQRSLLPPSSPWSRTNLQDWILFSRNLHSTKVQFLNPGYAISSLPACINSQSLGCGEEHHRNSCNP